MNVLPTTGMVAMLPPMIIALPVTAVVRVILVPRWFGLRSRLTGGWVRACVLFVLVGAAVTVWLDKEAGAGDDSRWPLLAGLGGAVLALTTAVVSSVRECRSEVSRAKTVQRLLEELGPLRPLIGRTEPSARLAHELIHTAHTLAQQRSGTLAMRLLNQGLNELKGGLPELDADGDAAVLSTVTDLTRRSAQHLETYYDVVPHRLV